MAKNQEGEKPTMIGVVRPFLTIFFAELLGTMILMFLGCGACIDFDGDPPTAHHLKSIGFGFAVLVAIQVVGHLTACHINPAVTLTSLLLRRISVVQFVVYIMAQFLGSLLGFGLLKVLLPEHLVPNGFCITRVGSGVTLTQGFFIELVLTCILCFVICSVWDDRNANWADSVPLRFALIVGLLSIVGPTTYQLILKKDDIKELIPSIGLRLDFMRHLKGYIEEASQNKYQDIIEMITKSTIGPFTGASLNTARSFGPAVFGSKEDWLNDQWVYWIAPNISPFISVGFYKLFFSEPKVKSRSEDYS